MKKGRGGRWKKEEEEYNEEIQEGHTNTDATSRVEITDKYSLYSRVLNSK